MFPVFVHCTVVMQENVLVFKKCTKNLEEYHASILLISVPK